MFLIVDAEKSAYTEYDEVFVRKVTQATKQLEVMT